MEDIDGAIGIRATIDASDIQKSAQEWVDTIMNMQSKTNEVVQGMNESLSSMQKQVDEFGRAVNGMSVSEIGNKLNEAKANFVELGQTIEQQKVVIADITSAVQDYARAYKEAKESGNTNEIKAAKEALDEAKDSLTLAKNEQHGFTEEQKKAKAQITELTQAYKEIQSSQPTFDNVVSGATTATEKIEALRQSFNTFQQNLQSQQSAIDSLSADSANASSVGENGVRNLVQTVETRYIVEGADEVQAKNEAVSSTIKNVQASYAAAAATAQTAYNEQKNVVQALEGQIKNLQTIMQEAVKAGDMSSATEIASQIQQLETSLINAKNRLVELQNQSKQANQNLLDFGRVSADVSQRAEQQTSAWGRLKERISQLGDGVSNFANNQLQSAKGVISSFTSQIDGMGIPLSNSIAGMKQLTLASLRFIATPVGAVLGAIVLYLKAVHTWLNKSAEGQKKMAQISAFFGSIMASVTDIVVAFGGYLFKTLTGSNKAVSVFINNFVTTFKNGFYAVKDLVVGFGAIFKGVWGVINGDIEKGWEAIKQGASQMGTGFKEALQAVISHNKTWVSAIGAAYSTVKGLFTDKELSNSLTKAFTNLIPNAKKSARLALENLNLAKEEGETKLRNAKLQDRIDEQQNKIYSLQGKEKDAAIEKLKAMKLQLYYGRQLADGTHESGLLDIAKKRLAITKAQNDMHVKNLSQLSEERNLQTEIYLTESKAHASVRMLNRMQAANIRSMNSKANSASKRELNQHNAITSASGKLAEVVNQNAIEEAAANVSLEESLANARIKAMKDGYARTRAEKAQQNKEELLAIEQQRIKAVEAEKKRQKAEFDATQALIKARGGRVSKWNEDKDLDKGKIDKINEQFNQLKDFKQESQNRSTIDELAKEYDKQEVEKINKLNKLRADIAELEEQLAKATSEAEKNELNKLRQNAQAQLDWVSQSKDAWNEYYQKYGTFLEKRAALEEKFKHDTQGMDKSSAEYKTKEKEKENGVKALEFEELKKQLNWEDVFGDLSRLGKSALADLQKQLETLIQNDKNLSVESIKTINEAINKVRAEQAKKGSLIGNMFSSFRDLKSKKNAAEKANEQVKNVAGGSIWKRYKEAENSSDTEKKAEIRNEQVYDPVSKKLITFGELLDRAAKATKDYTEAEKTANETTKSVGSGFKTLSTMGKDVSGMLEKFGVSMPDGLTQVFDGFGEIGDVFEGFDLTKIGSFLDVGNYVHAVTGVVSGVADVFVGFAKLFGHGSGEKAYKQELAHYEKLSGIWSDLIDKKKEYIDMSFGNEAKKAIADVEALYKAEEKSIKNVTRTFLSKRSFNAHSQAYRANEAINNAGGFNKWSSLAGVNISRIEDLYSKNYTYDQLVKLKGADNGEFWASLGTEMQDYLDKLIECKKGTEDFQQEALEKLTGVKFDDMYSNFMSALTDMSKSADDWVSDFKDKIRSAIIENMMGGKVKSWMKDYTERYQAAMKAGNGIISEAQKQQFIDEAKEMSNQFYEERKQITENVGLGKSSTESSKSGGYATASEESIEELSGRALATNEALYSIRNQQLIDAATLVSINDGLQVIVTIENKRNAYYDESIEIQRTSVSHLAAIEKNTNELYTMNAKLTKIERNTRNM